MVGTLPADPKPHITAHKRCGTTPHPRAPFFLGVVHHDQGDTDIAVHWLSKATELGDSYALDLLTVALGRDGFLDWMQEAVAKRNPAARAFLAKVRESEILLAESGSALDARPGGQVDWERLSHRFDFWPSSPSSIGQVN